MKIEIQNQGAFASALIQLEQGEEFVSEAGAMYRASSNLDIDVTTRSKGKGGVLAGVKRWLAKESFFFSKYRIDNAASPGAMQGSAASAEVGLAPTHQGDIHVLELDGSSAWFTTGGSFLGASSELALDTQFQGMKGFLGGESLSFLRVDGRGTLLVSAFGRIAELEVQDELIVDTGHVVAFEASLDYRITKAGTSWMHSFFGGEGLVFHFSGRGRLLVQSHNPKDLGPQLGRLLPPKR